jgi:molecular chaperone GrpE
MDDQDDPRPTPEGAPGGPHAGPATVDRVAELEAALAAARDEARQNHERWVRERADLENLRKRAARERQDALLHGNETLLRDLLPVVDNLERAVEAAREGGNGKPIVEGIELVLKAFLDVLERHGVARMAARGAPFDPSHHEAVAHVESHEHEPNLVIDEHQPGYRLRDRLLRPALVTVSKGKPGRSKLVKDEGGD